MTNKSTTNQNIPTDNTLNKQQVQAESDLIQALSLNHTAPEGLKLIDLDPTMKLVPKKKSKAEISRERNVKETVERELLIKQQPVWIQNLKYRLGKDRYGAYGRIIDTSSMENLVRIITNDDATKNKFAYNSFSRKIEIVEPVTIVGKTYPAGYLTNMIYNRLARHLDIKYDVIITESRSAEALIQAAEELEYNPVRDYVNSCKEVYKTYPGEYIDNFFVKTLGAESTDALKLTTHILLNEMVAKAFDPFAKAEFSIDTIGSQGVGKTRVFEALFSIYDSSDLTKTIKQANKKSFFLNNVTAISDKDAQLKISQNWGFIDDELEATRKSSFEEMKALLSTTFFEIRGAYQRSSEVVPRTAVIVRTTNENDYLKDKSGQRRFLPVLSRKEHKQKDISDVTVLEMMAMIGQAVVEFENGFDSNHLKPEQLEMFEEVRENFTYESSIADVVNRYLQIKIPKTWSEWLPEMKQRYIQDQLQGVEATTYSGLREGATPMQNGLVSFKVEDLVNRDYVSTSEIVFEALKEGAGSRNFSKVKYELVHSKQLTDEKRFTVKGKTIRGFKFL